MLLVIPTHITFSPFAVALICKVLTEFDILCERLQNFTYTFVLLALCTFSTICFPTFCVAGTLILKGDLKIQAQLDGNDVLISGSYTAKNAGNERMREALLTLSIGEWKWAGEPVELAPDESHKWQINGRFALDQLSCKHTKSCADVNLPMRGKFPVLVHKLYQDVNGYQFSVPDVTYILIGELNSDETYRLHVPTLLSRMKINKDGQNFLAKLTIRNTSTEPKRLVNMLFTTREFSVKNDLMPKTIAPSEQVSMTSEIENFRGIAGNAYTIFGITQWDDAGLRNTTWAYQVAQTSAKRSRSVAWYIYASIASTLIALAGLYVCVIKQHANT